MQNHSLKTAPLYFRALRAGIKTFEVRFDDRGYDLDDILNLQEYDELTKTFTGRSEIRRVSYMTRLEGLTPGILAPGWVILGLEKLRP